VNLRESANPKSSEVPSFQEFASRRRRQLEDRELIARVLSGEDAAFATLMERYMPCVLGHLAGRTRCPADTEDITQEIFLTAYRNLARLRDPERIGAWLVNIAHSRLVDFYRAESRRPKTASPAAHSDPHGSTGWELGRDSAPTPADVVSERQTRQVILQEIARMREPYRVVLYMRLVGEESSGEIARRLGLASATVRQRLLRGMRRLRKALRKHGLELPLSPESRTEDDREAEE